MNEQHTSRDTDLNTVLLLSILLVWAQAQKESLQNWICSGCYVRSNKMREALTYFSSTNLTLVVMWYVLTFVGWDVGLLLMNVGWRRTVATARWTGRHLTDRITHRATDGIHHMVFSFFSIWRETRGSWRIRDFFSSDLAWKRCF